MIFTVVKMGPSWKDIKHVQLLDPREVAEERKWDEDFQKRQKELQLQRRKAEERRFVYFLFSDPLEPYMSHVMRNPVFRVCDQARLAPACSATETS